MSATIRHDWTKPEIAQLYELPFLDLLLQAQQLHRQFFPANQVQKCQLLNIKTGACPEDCAYCPQSRAYNTGLKKESLFNVETVLANAKQAKENGATRFCMGAAWRRPPKAAMPKLMNMIREIKALGLETCVTLGTLSTEQAQQLKAAGLDYYNHNLDTSAEHYPKIITTRPYQERLDTLAKVHDAGINVCCGGIMGLGETREDRVSFLHQLVTLAAHPQSVPINRLIAVPGTPLEHALPIDNIEFVRTIAVARILMPKSFVRLSAGRDTMTAELQALCFMAGANSIFLDEILLTQKNPSIVADTLLMQQLGLEPMEINVAQEHECA